MDIGIDIICLPELQQCMWNYIRALQQHLDEQMNSVDSSGRFASGVSPQTLDPFGARRDAEPCAPFPKSFRGNHLSGPRCLLVTAPMAPKLLHHLGIGDRAGHICTERENGYGAVSVDYQTVSASADADDLNAQSMAWQLRYRRRICRSGLTWGPISMPQRLHVVRCSTARRQDSYASRSVWRPPRACSASLRPRACTCCVCPPPTSESPFVGSR